MFKGKLSRGSYFFGCLWIAVVGTISNQFAFDDHGGTTSYFGMHLGLTIILLIINANYVVKRLNDLGLSGASYFLLWVPVYNIYFGFVLLLKEGKGKAIVSEKQQRSSPEDTIITEEMMSKDRSPCIYCSEMVLRDASYCRFCRADLPGNWFEIRKRECPFCKQKILETETQCLGCKRKLPSNWSEKEPLPCPFCAEVIPGFSINCQYCEKKLELDWGEEVKANQLSEMRDTEFVAIDDNKNVVLSGDKILNVLLLFGFGLLVFIIVRATKT